MPKIFLRFISLPLAISLMVEPSFATALAYAPAGGLADRAQISDASVFREQAIVAALLSRPRTLLQHIPSWFGLGRDQAFRRQVSVPRSNGSPFNVITGTVLTF